MAYSEVTEQRTPILNLKNPGEFVEGFLLEIRPGKYGQLADLMGLDQQMGTITLSTDLLNKIKQVPMRTLVKIELVDRKKLESGNEIKIYKVMNDKATSFDTWMIDQINKRVPEEKTADEVPF